MPTIIQKLKLIMETIKKILEEKKIGKITTKEMIEKIRLSGFNPRSYEKYLGLHYLKVLDKDNKELEITL